MGRLTWSRGAQRPWRRRAGVALVAVLTGAVASVPAAVQWQPPASVVAPTTTTSRPHHGPTGAAAARAGSPIAAAAPVAVAGGADVAIAPPPPAFDAPPAVAVAPPAILRAASAAPTAPAGGVWAVVIGIDDYPGSGSDLRASVADADTVDRALADYGVTADRRLVVRNTQATAAVIHESVRWLVHHAGPDATAVLFYAGHVRDLGGGTQAIVAADGELVTDRALADDLGPLTARQTWIALASCFGGGFDEVLAPGRILTAAAPSGALAYENAQYGNSYLVEYMVQRAMLEGSAPGSVEQAFAWAQAAIGHDHPNRLPVQFDQLDGELALGAPPDRPPPAEPAEERPPSSSPPASPTTTTTEPPRERSCLLNLGSLTGCDDGTTGD